MNRQCGNDSQAHYLKCHMHFTFPLVLTSYRTDLSYEQPSGTNRSCQPLSFNPKSEISGTPHSNNISLSEKGTMSLNLCQMAANTLSLA